MAGRAIAEAACAAPLGGNGGWNHAAICLTPAETNIMMFMIDGRGKAPV